MANCCLIFSAFIAVLAAIVLGLYFSETVPEGMPADQVTLVRMFGVNFRIMSFLVNAVSFIGIGESPIMNEKKLGKWLEPNQVAESDEFLEVRDDKIANIPVRIYKPKSLDADQKSTGFVYLHGGGWTIGSVGW